MLYCINKKKDLEGSVKTIFSVSSQIQAMLFATQTLAIPPPLWGGATPGPGSAFSINRWRAFSKKFARYDNLFQSNLILHPDSHVTTRTSVISLGEASSHEANITLTCALIQRGSQGGKQKNNLRNILILSSGVILHQDAIQTQVSLSHRETGSDRVVELWPGWVHHQAVFDILFATILLVFTSLGNN